MESSTLIASLITLLVCVLTIWGTRSFAERAGLVDHPGGRKVHDGAIPLTGGIGIWVGVCLAAGFLDHFDVQLFVLIFGAGCVLLTGTIDDLVDLSVVIRFGSQILAAIGAVSTGVVLQDLGVLTGAEPIHLGEWGAVLTVFAVVGVINATNMIDGADGLAGSLVAVTLGGILAAAVMVGQAATIEICAIWLAGVVGFLAFNLRTPWRAKAAVFMGNGGSAAMGFVVAWMLVSSTQGERALFPPVTALWLFAVPLFDTLCVMSRRLMQGKSPFSPDRGHLHHLLLSYGLSTTQTVAVIAAGGVGMAGVGLFGWFISLPDVYSFAGFMISFAVYLIAIHVAWRRIALREDSISSSPADLPQVSEVSQ